MRSEYCYGYGLKSHPPTWISVALAAQNRKSRDSQNRGSGIARNSAARSKKESNRNKVESQKIDSESPSESHPMNALSDLGIARCESHDSESPDSRFRRGGDLWSRYVDLWSRYVDLWPMQVVTFDLGRPPFCRKKLFCHQKFANVDLKLPQKKP